MIASVHNVFSLEDLLRLELFHLTPAPNKSSQHDIQIFAQTTGKEIIGN